MTCEYVHERPQNVIDDVINVRLVLLRLGVILIATIDEHILGWRYINPAHRETTCRIRGFT